MTISSTSISGSRSLPPSDDNYYDELAAAMDATSSPVRPSASLLGKRRRSSNHSDFSDDDESHQNTDAPEGSEPPRPALNVPSNQNIVTFAKKLSTQKRLRPEQVVDVNTFLADESTIRQIKLFVQGLALENKLDKIIAAAPVYEVSEALAQNIWNYSVAVLTSSKIAAYKGSIPTNHLLNILKKHRFDMPAGIEHNLADWKKVTSHVQDCLTQLRSCFKKLLLESINSTDDSSHMNIFELAQLFIKGTSCVVTVPLCARIALMCSVVAKTPGSKFWDKLDEGLAKIREKAGNDPNKISKAFKHVLDGDRKKHGFLVDYTIPEAAAGEWQEGVDNAIEATTSG